ncbi:MAG: hypothetical protein O3B84_01370 [Chloroflexi bacterium]|nr:hypothetical protein [Chloroflexota bacterium]
MTTSPFLSQPVVTDVVRGSIAEQIEGFVSAVRGGTPWFPALLKVVGAWSAPEEAFDGVSYRYLMSGEAFDWLLLANRLLLEVAESVPEDERAKLLFEGEPPTAMGAQAFRDAIGAVKHSAHMNLWYGVVVEQALQQAVLEEVAKARQTLGSTEDILEDEAFRRLYDATSDSLLVDFRRASGLDTGSIVSSLGEQQSFTYWLFKRRVSRSDPARLASDTLKGLRKLERLGAGSWHWVGLEPNE